MRNRSPAPGRKWLADGRQSCTLCGGGVPRAPPVLIASPRQWWTAFGAVLVKACPSRLAGFLRGGFRAQFERFADVNPDWPVDASSKCKVPEGGLLEHFRGGSGGAQPPATRRADYIAPLTAAGSPRSSHSQDDSHRGRALRRDVRCPERDRRVPRLRAPGGQLSLDLRDADSRTQQGVRAEADGVNPALYEESSELRIV